MPRLYLQNKDVIWHKLGDRTEQVFVQRDRWEGALDGEKRGLLVVTSVPGAGGLVRGEGLRLRGQKEGSWPRPTPWPVGSPRDLSEHQVPDGEQSLPPGAVMRWKRGPRSAGHALAAELTQSTDRRGRN